MKFISEFKATLYVVRPATYRYFGNNQRESIPGLRAQFADHILDTEAQAWSEEDRAEVEEYLLGHADFGLVLSLLDEAALAVAASPYHCLFMVVTGGEANICGTTVAVEGDLCPKHQVLAAAEAAEPESDPGDSETAEPDDALDEVVI